MMREDREKSESGITSEERKWTEKIQNKNRKNVQQGKEERVVLESKDSERCECEQKLS